jgi:acyl-CoA reductase-like NAD-dependent aldehyde dehydrogenase
LKPLSTKKLFPRDRIVPWVTEEAAKRVESWVKEAAAGGARIECGGARPGAIIEPTVIIGASHEMTVVCKEVFGPVVSIFGYESLEDVIALANSTLYGLQAGVHTESLDVRCGQARSSASAGSSCTALCAGAWITCSTAA